MNRFAAALLVLGLATALSPSALAQTSKKEADARARELYEQGDAAYAEARYEQALDAFREAYELSKRPGLLYNMGNAYERLGRPAEAADALEKYLPHAKKSEKAVIEKRVENLRKRAEEEKAAEAERAAAEAQAEAERERTQPDPAPAPVPREPERQSPTLGWVLVGVGGAAIATGAVFGVMALGARSDADAGCKDSGGKRFCSADARDAIDRDESFSLVADVAFVAGAVAAGIGVYLVLDAPDSVERESAASKTRLQAMARPDGGELSLVGSF